MRHVTLILSAAVLALSVADAHVARGQGTPAPGAGPANTASGAAASGGSAGGSSTTRTTTTTSGVQFYPGGVAPLPPGGVLGGGNTTTSSSRPKTGGESDTFDLGNRGPRDVSVRGSGTGPIFGASESMTLDNDSNPSSHSVKKGDTLWRLCDQYYQNPYQWPRIWSYNPQIQNPHWIEVGDQIRLRPILNAGQGAPSPGADGLGTNTGRFVDARRRVPLQTVFLREEGFVENEGVDTWGEITGAAGDKMFLTDTDEVYIRIAPGKEVHLGQELTIFRPVRDAGEGKVVAIQGTVRLNQYNPKDRIARATVIETLDVVERGARLGAIPRRFEVVPPVRNEKDVVVHVLASVYFHSFYGANQVVYVDKGADDGLKPGNRLFAMRQGDPWRRSLPGQMIARRIALESDRPAEVETIPPPRDENKFPEEVIGELRVLTTKAKTAMCIVTSTSREIEVGETAVQRKGY